MNALRRDLSSDSRSAIVNIQKNDSDENVRAAALAVQINHEKILNPLELISLQKETKIKIGKRNFYELL